MSCSGNRQFDVKCGAPSKASSASWSITACGFDHDRYGLTLGGGQMNNPGRYLVLIPPINGATAFQGTPYFTANPGDPFKAWDVSATFDYMPSQYITFRWEYDHRAANVPYFSGPWRGHSRRVGNYRCGRLCRSRLVVLICRED